jgi:putative ABC transport system ATP-binding protein
MCIEFKNISLKLADKTLLNDVNIYFKRGFNLVYGESGSGKTSLLKLINMLYSPSMGGIFYKKKDISEYIPSQWRSVCILTKQIPSLIDGSVFDNLLFPFTFKAHKHKTIDKKLMMDLIKQFKLKSSILDEPTSKLSGGEAQRVAVIRTLLLKPDIYLFDEPTSALDSETQNIVFSYIKGLSRKHICVVCSHTNKAFEFCDISIKIDKGSAQYD